MEQYIVTLRRTSSKILRQSETKHIDYNSDKEEHYTFTPKYLFL